MYTLCRMITEKRGINFDKVAGEWKAKADDLMAETKSSVQLWSSDK